MAGIAAALHTALAARNPDVDSEDLAGQVRSTLARAGRFASCLLTDSLGDGEQAAAVAILEDVIQRRLDLRSAGVLPGIATSRALGGRSKSVDGKGITVALFQPGEIAELQDLCQSVSGSTPATPGGLPVGSFPPASTWPC